MKPVRSLKSVQNLSKYSADIPSKHLEKQNHKMVSFIKPQNEFKLFDQLFPENVSIFVKSINGKIKYAHKIK